MNARGFARSMEAAYRIAWQKWCDSDSVQPERSTNVTVGKTPYRIVMLQPPGHVWSAGLHELACLLEISLSDLGYPVCIDTNSFSKGAINIVLGLLPASASESMPTGFLINWSNWKSEGRRKRAVPANSLSRARRYGIMIPQTSHFSGRTALQPRSMFRSVSTRTCLRFPKSRLTLMCCTTGSPANGGGASFGNYQSDVASRMLPIAGEPHETRPDRAIKDRPECSFLQRTDL